MISEQQAKSLENETIEFISIQKGEEMDVYIYSWQKQHFFRIIWVHKHEKRLQIEVAKNYEDFYLYERSRVFWGFKEMVDPHFELKKILGAHTYTVIDKHVVGDIQLLRKSWGKAFLEGNKLKIDHIVRNMEISTPWKHFFITGYGTSGKMILEYLENQGVGVLVENWYTRMSEEVYALKIDLFYPFSEVRKLSKELRKMGFAIDEEPMG